jgi:CheY-specific phosphatase CheX
MEKQLDRPLREAAASTFEHLGFLFAEPDLGTPDEDEGAVDWSSTPGATVSFAGGVEGRLELRVTADVARQVTSTMLAASPPVSEDLVSDALGELSNVMCGNLVPVLCGPAGECSLGAPHPWLEGAPDGLGTPTAQVGLRVGPGKARIRLFLADPERTEP